MIRKLSFARILTVSIIGVISVVSIVYGVKLMDIPEIISNGSILCLSCIGIG